MSDAVPRVRFTLRDFLSADTVQLLADNGYGPVKCEVGEE